MGALTFVRADPGNILGSDPRHRPFRPRSPAQLRVAGRAVVGCGDARLLNSCQSLLPLPNGSRVSVRGVSILG